MKLIQAFLVLAFLLLDFGRIGIVARAIPGSASAAIASTVSIASGPFSIGCDSIIAGYILPPCALTNVTPGALTITELTTLASTAFTVTTPDTITMTLAPTTVTQTVAYVRPMTTVSAFCFDASENAMLPCTTTVPVPSAIAMNSTVHSGVNRGATNPFKLITNFKVLQVVLSLSTPACGYPVGVVVVRDTNYNKPLCAWAIVSLTVAGLSIIAFILVVMYGFRQHRELGGVKKTTEVVGYFMLGFIAWWLACGLSNVNHCV